MGALGKGGLQQTSAHRYRCQCQHSQGEQWRLFTSLPGCRAGGWFRHLLQRRSDQTDHFILINKLPQWYRQQQKRDYSVGVYLMRRWHALSRGCTCQNKSTEPRRRWAALTLKGGDRALLPPSVRRERGSASWVVLAASAPEASLSFDGVQAQANGPAGPAELDEATQAFVCGQSRQLRQRRTTNRVTLESSQQRIFEFTSTPQSKTHHPSEMNNKYWAQKF